jgi:hypothetical protein
MVNAVASHSCQPGYRRTWLCGGHRGHKGMGAVASGHADDIRSPGDGALGQLA